MPANTAASSPIETVDAPSRASIALPYTVGLKPEAAWKPRHLLSTFSDRRSLRKIGGLGAYLTQVRWSLRWALRHRAR